MSVHLALTCDGCPATATTDYLRKRFVSFSGRDHGFGHFYVGDPEKLTPDGWVMFDPYTQCTYCPKCWAAIEERAGSNAEQDEEDTR